QEAEAKKLAEQQTAEEARKKQEEQKKQEQAKLEEEQRLAQAKAEEERRQQEEDAKRQEEAEQVAQVQPPPVQEQREQPEPVKEAPKPQAAPVQQSTVKEGDLVEIGSGVTKPELTNRINPDYPLAAQRKKVEGTVILSILVSESGSVADVKLLRQAGGASGLNEAAVAAARKWKFRPAVKDGKRVKVWVTYPIVFKIH
ncbi:MAG TPA: energy transducer TonB, partial [Acidobacteriota bacterium]|nr:energy transducer TonB [Acidobacteriota bacterium]